MNFRLIPVSVILKKYIFVYLFLSLILSVIPKEAPSDIQWKMRKKHTASGPTYTFLKTDKHANIKWGVRHYVPRAPRMSKYTANIDHYN